MKRSRKQLELLEKEREEHLAFDAWLDAYDRGRELIPSPLRRP